MSDKKITWITIGLTAFYLCLLTCWHFYDPSASFTESQPGADHRPAGHTRKADDVLIGEFFMQEEGEAPRTDLKGEWPCFRGANHDNQVSTSPSVNTSVLSFEELWSVETGEGHAAPVISEGRVYVLDYDEGLSSDALRCFDLLGSVHDTGCMPLAYLNAEGYVAGCEGDVPAMLSMMIARSLIAVSGFQANPATINPETGELLFAHCTIPLDMVERYELDTHFESGIGTAIRGYMKPGPVTIFKVSGDLSRHFIAEGELVRNQAKPDLCRTQQVIQLADPSQAGYFLTNPIGNHHIILPGHLKTLLETFQKCTPDPTVFT